MLLNLHTKKFLKIKLTNNFSDRENADDPIGKKKTGKKKLNSARSKAHESVCPMPICPRSLFTLHFDFPTWVAHGNRLYPNFMSRWRRHHLKWYPWVRSTVLRNQLPEDQGHPQALSALTAHTWWVCPCYLPSQSSTQYQKNENIQ